MPAAAESPGDGEKAGKGEQETPNQDPTFNPRSGPTESTLVFKCQAFALESEVKGASEHA